MKAKIQSNEHTEHAEEKDEVHTVRSLVRLLGVMLEKHGEEALDWKLHVITEFSLSETRICYALDDDDDPAELAIWFTGETFEPTLGDIAKQAGNVAGELMADPNFISLLPEELRNILFSGMDTKNVH